MHSHSISFGNDAVKDTAGCRASCRNYIVINDHSLSSEVGFKGICRKVLIFLLVGIGHILDAQVIGTGSVLRTAVIFFYISNEGVSLLENAAHLGLPVPEKVKAVLEQLHDRAEKENE